jgi:hypothetical protein
MAGSQDGGGGGGAADAEIVIDSPTWLLFSSVAGSNACTLKDSVTAVAGVPVIVPSELKASPSMLFELKLEKVHW